jgi:predicted dehydrogenase
MVRTANCFVAFFGAGRWERHFLRLPSNLGCRAEVCRTRTPHAGEWLAAEYPFARHTTELGEGLASGVRAAVIAIPRPLGTGMHVPAEKPPAKSVSTVRSLWDAARFQGDPKDWLLIWQDTKGPAECIWHRLE